VQPPGRGLLVAARQLIDATVGESEQRQTRLRRVAPLAGLPVGLLDAGELAAEAQQLGLLVARHTHHGVAGGLGEVGTGPLDLLHRLGPLAVELHDLGAVNQALPLVGVQILLIAAPAAEDARALLCSPQVEHHPAGDDDGAVGHPGQDRGGVAGRDRDHDLVEQWDAVVDVALRDQRLAKAEQAQDGVVGVVEAARDRRDLLAHLVGPFRVVLGVECVERDRDQQVAAGGAVEVGVECVERDRYLDPHLGARANVRTPGVSWPVEIATGGQVKFPTGPGEVSSGPAPAITLA
jgi:hypothetical protein